MSLKRDSQWLADHEEELMVKVCERALENARKMGMMCTFCVEEFRETVKDMTAMQLLDAIHAFLKTEPNEVTAYVYLHLLAYYPRSMTSYNLTPFLQHLIAFSYYMGQLDKTLPKLSMEELANMLNRSKSTIHDAVLREATMEKRLRADADAEQDRQKARKEAYRELVEEEKQLLKVQHENAQKNQGNVRTNGAGN